ncbi:MAG: decarboxylase, partial [Pseudomonadota bacterium]
GLGLDVSSGLELSLALSLGCRKIIFSGPGKTDEELTLALRNRSSVTILLDSGGELDRISRLAKGTEEREGSIRVGIRIRGRHHGIWDKFGVPLDDLGALLTRAIASPVVKAEGFQFHTSWNRDPGPQIEMIKTISSYLKTKVPRDIRRSLKFLDIGGGYWPERGEWLNPQNTFRGKLVQVFEPHYPFRHRHYYLKSKPLDHFVRAISRAIALEGEPLNRLEIWMEPGRWISTPAMHILLTVIDKKDEGMVITDGGINLLGWERPLSEFIPVINLTRPSLEEMPVRIFGSLCTPLDIWGTSLFGRGILPGDVLLIPDQGSYTYGLRQSFIKPKARVIRYDGTSLNEVEPEESF